MTPPILPKVDFLNKLKGKIPFDKIQSKIMTLGAFRQSVFILIPLLVVSLGLTGLTILDKRKIARQKISVEGDLKTARAREKESLAELNSLKGQLNLAQQEKLQFEQTIAELQKSIEERLTEISAITVQGERSRQALEEIAKERAEFIKERDALAKERDELIIKLKEKPEVVYEQRVGVEGTGGAGDIAQPARIDQASLEAEIERLKGDILQRSVTIDQFKKENNALRTDLEALRRDKEKIEDDIAAKEGMINNLTLELSKVKDDHRFVTQKADKLTQQNMALHEQIKRSFDAKAALERSITRTMRQKDAMENELKDARAIVQKKVDEIWKIKHNLDNSFQPIESVRQSAPGEVELSPIVVNHHGPVSASRIETDATDFGFKAKILSINEGNNFVVLDTGEKHGLRVGDTLGVYRDSEYIARLQIIQTRPNIAAADLKDQWSKVQVGDIVR